MRPGTLPGLLRAPSLSKEGSRGPFGFVWGDELLCPWRVLSWTAPAARSLFVRKENGGLGSTPLGGGKKRGLWPQSQDAPAEPGHKNPPPPKRRGKGKEEKGRGYLETVYQVSSPSTVAVVAQPSPSTILPVLAFTGSTVVLPGSKFLKEPPLTVMVQPAVALS